MKPAYFCDYCGQLFPQGKIVEHENQCMLNPKRKCCCTCANCMTTTLKDGEHVISRQYTCQYQIPSNQLNVITLHDKVLNDEEYRSGYCDNYKPKQQ